MTIVTMVTVVTMVTICNTGSEGCVSDNGMTSVSGHTLLLLDTEGLGDVDKVRTPTLHYLHTCYTHTLFTAVVGRS